MLYNTTYICISYIIFIWQLIYLHSAETDKEKTKGYSGLFRNIIKMF